MAWKPLFHVPQFTDFPQLQATPPPAERRLHSKGSLSPDQCGEVLAYFLDIYPEDRVFDIRILIRCLDDRLGAKTLGSKITSTWKELVTSQVGGYTEPPVTRKEKIARETVIALELSRKNLSKSDLLEVWKERTDRKSLDSYYRRLRQLQ